MFDSRRSGIVDSAEIAQAKWEQVEKTTSDRTIHP